MKALVLAAALLAVALFPTAAGAPQPVVDTIDIAAGADFQETIYPPTDGSPWTMAAIALNGSGPFDAYIVRSTDLINAYPSGAFTPLAFSENNTSLAFDFNPPEKIVGYTLIIDNRDNARATDAVPTGNLTVRITRTPPLRSNPEAQALLGAGAGICTAILAVATVAVAIYLKRRPREELVGELDPDQPRTEIEIEVPKPPRGAWARPAEEEPPTPEESK